MINEYPVEVIIISIAAVITIVIGIINLKIEAEMRHILKPRRRHDILHRLQMYTVVFVPIINILYFLTVREDLRWLREDEMSNNT